MARTCASYHGEAHPVLASGPIGSTAVGANQLLSSAHCADVEMAANHAATRQPARLPKGCNGPTVNSRPVL